VAILLMTTLRIIIVIVNNNNIITARANSAAQFPFGDRREGAASGAVRLTSRSSHPTPGCYF
jgi:hypothetical protein